MLEIFAPRDQLSECEPCPRNLDRSRPRLLIEGSGCRYGQGRESQSTAPSIEHHRHPGGQFARILSAHHGAHCLSVCIVAWVPAAMIDAFMLVVAPDEGAGRGALASRSYPGPDYIFNIIDEAAQVRRHSPLQHYSHSLSTSLCAHSHSVALSSAHRSARACTRAAPLICAPCCHTGAAPG